MNDKNNNSNLDWMIHWSLTEHTPRNTQIKLINRINVAMSEGYKNIILEAGTGIGKSAIATTLANMYEDSYILTMTNNFKNSIWMILETCWLKLREKEIINVIMMEIVIFA